MERGLSLTQLEHLTGYSRGYLHLVESRKYHATAPVVAALSHALKVSEAQITDWLQPLGEAAA